MSKMKELKLAIVGVDSELTPLAANIYTEAEVVRVYQSDDGYWYLLSVDGVPQSPWLQRRDMVHLLTSTVHPADEAGEAIARYEQEQSWRKNYRKGDWEL